MTSDGPAAESEAVRMVRETEARRSRWASEIGSRGEHDVLNEDVARLCPLNHANLNVLGRSSFRASTPAGGSLRPLRDPATADTDEEG